MELREQLQRTFGDAYTVERELGGGGMSRVFLARDMALERPVVVKVLPTELTAAVSIERFKREIRLAASLQQANIVPVLSAGDADGVPYYTMPFVKGESLRSRLVAKGTLPVTECVAILRDVARALAFAHDEGVVHRDIKPENILLSGGTAVVTDFGIAKAVAASTTQPGAPTLTQLGVAIGTPAYMAPEQAVGEAVDHRADIYSLGVVAYEMLAGSAPFSGRSAQAMLAAHAMEAPEPLAKRRQDVPRGLAELITQCLAKEQGDRPQSAEAVLIALDTVTTPQPAVTADTSNEKPSIAVLPFANLSPDPADEYFADGLTDEIITDLSPIHSLRVIARASMMRFKGSGKDPRTVARELQVRYVLDGSVRRAGSTLRLTARLIDAIDGSTLWTDKLGGTVEDVFDMQEKVSRTIVDALRLAISPREEQHLRSRPITDLRAYESYLQARQLMWTFTVPALEKAQRLLEATQARIGENARLIAALGGVHLNFIETGQVDPGPHLAAAEHCADRLARLEPDSFALHSIRGWVQWRRGEIREAIVSLSRARELEPNSPDVSIVLCYAYILAGQDDKAHDIAAETGALDPMTPLFQCMPGFCEILAGRPANGVPYYRRFRDMDRDNPIAWLFFVWALCAADERREALGVADELARRFGTTPFSRIGQAYAHALRGEKAAGAAVLGPDLRSLSRHSEAMGTMLAGVQSLLGDADGAVDTLEDAVRLGLAHYPYLARDANLYAPLRSHPRFQRLLEVVRQRWERGGASAEDHERPSIASTTPSHAAAKRVVAVLPLANLSASADDEYFADGVTEDIIAQLSLIASLKVISRTSVLCYKKTDKSMRAIAEALGASHVVEGSVRRAGQRLRIVAKLVNARSDEQMWSQTFDRELTDVFAIQGEVAESTARALAARLTPAERERIERKPTESMDAYNAYLLGRFALNKRSPDELKKAITFFERAIELDASYAAPHAGLAEALVLAAIGYGAATLEAMPRAKSAAQRAIALDPQLADAHTALGYALLNFDWDAIGAQREFRRALELSPNSSHARQWLGQSLCYLGRFDEYAVEAQKAVELDPMSVMLTTERAWPPFFKGDYEGAMTFTKRALAMDPGFALARYNLAEEYRMLGRLDEAVREYATIRRESPDMAFVDAHFARLQVERGDMAAARAILSTLVQRADGGEAVNAFVATVLDALDEPARALEWLERALEVREPMLAFAHLQGWRLRSTPEFEAFLERVGILQQARHARASAAADPLPPF